MAQNAPPPVVIPMAGLIEQPGNDSVLIPVNHPLAVQFAPFLAPPAVPAQGGPAMRSGKLSYFSWLGYALYSVPRNNGFLLQVAIMGSRPDLAGVLRALAMVMAAGFQVSPPLGGPALTIPLIWSDLIRRALQFTGVAYIVACTVRGLIS